MLTIFRDLFKYDGRFRVAFFFLLFIIVFAVIAAVSPLIQKRPLSCRLTGRLQSNIHLEQPLAARICFGGWPMPYATRSSLVSSARSYRGIIAIAIGLTAGYRGGWIDRALMSFNDSFVVLPVLPILILLSFLMRGSMSLWSLGVLLGLLVGHGMHA